jgi:hypothetical protein
MRAVLPFDRLHTSSKDTILSQTLSQSLHVIYLPNMPSFHPVVQESWLLSQAVHCNGWLWRSVGASTVGRHGKQAGRSVLGPRWTVSLQIPSVSWWLSNFYLCPKPLSQTLIVCRYAFWFPPTLQCLTALSSEVFTLFQISSYVPYTSGCDPPFSQFPN